MTDYADRYRKLYSGVVYDAMTFDVGHPRPFVVSPNIIPLWTPSAPMVGPAFTCLGKQLGHGQRPQDDDRKRLDMLAEMNPGCVQVIDTGEDVSCAHFGDISGQLASAHGAAGVIIDGLSRDVAALEKSGFPTWARGVSPRDAFGQWRIVSWQHEVTLGDVLVHPGDWIFADRDGVMVIPSELVVAVLGLAEGRAVREQQIRDELKTSEPEAVYARLGRW